MGFFLFEKIGEVTSYLNRNERKKATKFILTVPCNYIQMIKAPYKASDQLRLKPLLCEFASGLELLN